MRSSTLKFFLILAILQSCAVSNSRSSSKEFKKSKTLASYSGMVNELTPYFGTYLQKNDTLYLRWIDIDPKKIKYFLSNKCVVDSTKRRLQFVDERLVRPLWDMSLTRNK